MRSRAGLIVLIIVVAAAAGAAAWWWAASRPGPVADTAAGTPGPAAAPGLAASGPAAEENVPAVRAATVTEASAGRTVRVTGTVLPQRDVTLVSKVAGTVEWVAGGMGHHVEAGQPVVRLDATELSLALTQARAQLDAAEANLARLEAGARDEEIAQVRAAVEQAELGLTRLGDVLARQEQLYAQGVIPEETLLSVRTEYEVARLQYESARQQLALVERGATEEELRAVRAQVRQAEAAVQLARQQLDHAVIRTPISGLLAVQPVQVGTLIAAGTPVAHVVDIDHVIIEAGVSERDVNELSPGQPVLVRVDALGGAAVPGVVDAVAPVADQQTRSFPVRFRVENLDHRLKPGMIARVEIPLEEAFAGPAVPQAAVVQRGGRSVVYVLEADGAGRWVARERAVVPGTPAGGLLAVAGVSVGELVVLSPGSLRDGAIVNPIELDGGPFPPGAGGGGM